MDLPSTEACSDDMYNHVEIRIDITKLVARLARKRLNVDPGYIRWYVFESEHKEEVKRCNMQALMRHTVNFVRCMCSYLQKLHLNKQQEKFEVGCNKMVRLLREKPYGTETALHVIKQMIEHEASTKPANERKFIDSNLLQNIQRFDVDDFTTFYTYFKTNSEYLQDTTRTTIKERQR